MQSSCQPDSFWSKGLLDASETLSYLGQPAYMPAEGVVAVGIDGSHVGIFIDSQHFVHSSSRRGEVIIVDEKKLNGIFEKAGGYVLRKGY